MLVYIMVYCSVTIECMYQVPKHPDYPLMGTPVNIINPAPSCYDYKVDLKTKVHDCRRFSVPFK